MYGGDAAGVAFAEAARKQINASNETQYLSKPKKKRNKGMAPRRRKLREEAKVLAFENAQARLSMSNGELRRMSQGLYENKSWFQTKAKQEMADVVVAMNEESDSDEDTASPAHKWKQVKKYVANSEAGIDFKEQTQQDINLLLGAVPSMPKVMENENASVRPARRLMQMYTQNNNGHTKANAKYSEKAHKGRFTNMNWNEKKKKNRLEKIIAPLTGRLGKSRSNLPTSTNASLPPIGSPENDRKYKSDKMAEHEENLLKHHSENMSTFARIGPHR
jgi:hypothetical protein